MLSAKERAASKATSALPIKSSASSGAKKRT
jgi:hypothetical protein